MRDRRDDVLSPYGSQSSYRKRKITITNARELTYNPDLDKMVTRKREYTVWLLSFPDEKWHMYWCPDCRQPIAQYKGELIMEYPGIDTMSPTSTPVLIQCRNSGCGRKVMFQDVIRRNE